MTAALRGDTLWFIRPLWPTLTRCASRDFFSVINNAVMNISVHKHVFLPIWGGIFRNGISATSRPDTGQNLGSRDFPVYAVSCVPQAAPTPALRAPDHILTSTGGSVFGLVLFPAGLYYYNVAGKP